MGLFLGSSLLCCWRKSQGFSCVHHGDCTQGQPPTPDHAFTTPCPGKRRGNLWRSGRGQNKSRELPALPLEASWRIGRGCECGRGRGRIHSRALLAGREDEGTRHNMLTSSSTPALRLVYSMPWNVLLYLCLVSRFVHHHPLAGRSQIHWVRRHHQSEARNKSKQ